MSPVRLAATEPAPGSFSLLETMRLEHGRIVRLEGHLNRMMTSARHFDYTWDDDAVRIALATCVRAHPDDRWRVRVMLSSAGMPTVECTSHTPDADQVWRVAFADAPVAPTNPFILNKTTHRIVYDDARRARPDVDDVVLWNSRGEVTETTIANIVAEIDGVRCTPPVACGLLAGVFRAELVESGSVRERVLTKADVINAPRLWLVNSLREWIDAALVA